MSVLFRRSEKKEKKNETGCKLRCVRTLLIKSAEGSRHLFPASRGTCSTCTCTCTCPQYLPTLDIRSSKSVPFSKKQKIRKNREIKKKDVPSTELAREGQFLAKVAEGKTKKSFLYNKNYYLIDEESSSTH